MVVIITIIIIIVVVVVVVVVFFCDFVMIFTCHNEELRRSSQIIQTDFPKNNTQPQNRVNELENLKQCETYSTTTTIKIRMKNNKNYKNNNNTIFTESISKKRKSPTIN